MKLILCLYGPTELMNCYDFQKEECKKCGKKEICIEFEGKWLCEYCFSWNNKTYAEEKDQIRSIMSHYRLRDIEN